MSLNSKIIFCKNVKLDRNNNNVLTYSESDMLTLLNSNGIKVAESNDYSFIGRKDRDAIDVSLNYNTLLGCNYIAFQNTNYNNKWYFAFIDKIEYLNDGASRVHYTVDIFATWWSYWSPKACFVSRENVNDDTPGLHTLPESLELGEHIIQSGNAYVDQSGVDYTTDLHYLRNVIIVVALVDWIPNYSIPSETRVYNGLYSGLKYYAFRNPDDADKFIIQVQSEFSSDPIHSIFVVPANLANIDESDWFDSYYGIEMAWYPVSEYESTMGEEIRILKPDHLDTNYVPVNKKLLTFPYCYLLISNNAGSVKEYRYEFFNNNVYCDFIIKGAIIPGCAIKLYPKGYNMKNSEVVMTAENNYEALDAAKLPTCAWTNDAYTNWLTQNSVNMSLNNIKNIGSIVAGGALALATGGTAAAAGGVLAVSGFSGIFDTMKQKYEHSLAPDTAKGGSNQGNLVFARRNTFTANRVSIRKETAETIDNFFSKFGYQINKIKLPNQVGRRYWNYVQTGNGEVLAYQKPEVVAIPSEDLVNINKLYQRGITLWHDHDNLGDYSLSNDIINPTPPPTPPPTPVPETTLIGTTIEASGVDDTKTSYINLLGNTTQDGTPTSADPKEIKVVTDNILVQISNSTNSLQTIHPVNLRDLELCKIGNYQDKILKSTGKNIFNKDSISYNDWGGTIGTSTYTDTITNAGKLANANPIPVEGGEYYIMTWTNPAGVIINEFNLYCYDNNGILISKFTSSGNSFGNNVPRQMPTDTAYINISSFGSYSQSQLNGIASTLMIEKSQTATSYEPYGIVWYLHKEIGKTTDTIGSNSKTINDMVSNASVYSYCGGNVSDKTITYDSSLVVENTIYYPLATSIGTPITDTTLISQLDELYTAGLFSGTTRIISYTNGDNPYIKLHYNIS